MTYGCEKTIAMITSNKYYEESLKISLRLQDEINNSNKSPKKTENHQNERFLTIEIPTTLRGVFGIIYSIYCVHVISGHYINKRLTTSDYVHFFGDKYIQIYGNNAFSNRRANKSYMDDIVDTTERFQHIDRKIMGYKVASYARAHVTGENGISESTSRYLRTKLDGLGVNEILILLFEMGTCSFIPYFLLEIVYGNKFSSLNVQEQTEIMKMSGLDAYKTEMLSKALVTSYRRTNSIIEMFFKQYHTEETKQMIAEQMLNNIVERSALAKISGMSCLCAAKRMPCPFPDRDCPGCAYGIYEASFLYQMMDRVRTAYKRLESSESIGEKKKMQMLIDEELLPGTCEILSQVKSKFHVDIEQYKMELMDLINTKGVIENVKNN